MVVLCNHYANNKTAKDECILFNQKRTEFQPHGSPALFIHFSYFETKLTNIQHIDNYNSKNSLPKTLGILLLLYSKYTHTYLNTHISIDVSKYIPFKTKKVITHILF